MKTKQKSKNKIEFETIVKIFIVFLFIIAIVLSIYFKRHYGKQLKQALNSNVNYSYNDNRQLQAEKE